MKKTAQLLLNNGADVNSCDNNGVSPLYNSCYNGHEGTAQLLLINGSNVITTKLVLFILLVKKDMKALQSFY